MKSIIFVGLTFVSAKSLAVSCPNFAGNYNCTFETTGPQDLEIRQRELDEVSIFTFNGNEAIADGQVRQMPNNDEIKDGFYKARCSHTELEIWQKGNLSFAEGYLEATLSLFFNDDGDLANENIGKIVINGKERSLNNRGICVRKSN